MASLDATKAFDRLWRAGLFFKLLDRIPMDTWRVLYSYYSSSRGAVRVGSSISDLFQIKDGVKQGGIISPLLFNFFINDLIAECINADVGALIGSINVSIVGYCDDIILISPIASHLRILLMICERYAFEWKLRFNPNKSSVYCTDKERLDTYGFEIGGVSLKKVKSFIYLGLPIGGKPVSDKWFEDKFRRTEKAFFSIKRVGLHYGILNPSCLGFIYRQFCQSICHYGLELISLSKGLLKNLDIRQNILLKTALGLPKRIKTSPLLDAMKISRLSELYLQFKLSFMKQIRSNGLALGVLRNFKKISKNIQG